MRISADTLSSTFKVIEANVLVIGGGFGGAWAALRASEITDGVVVVEKAYVSRSGASTMSGGVTSCPMPSDDLDTWAEEFIVRGGYTSDQDWTRQLLENHRERVKDLINWGVPITRDEKGEIRRFSSRGMIAARCMQYNPKKTMEELRRRLEARGVVVMDRIFIMELLTADGCWPTKGLFKAAIRDDNPVVIFEDRMLYNTSGETPVHDYVVPLGRAAVKRSGRDATLVATGRMVHAALAAADDLCGDDIEIEVIDVRTLLPLDMDTILGSVRKTHRALVVDGGSLQFGAAAEIAARISENAFDWLDAPVLRLAAQDVPIPANRTLEALVQPDRDRIAARIRFLVNGA